MAGSGSRKPKRFFSLAGIKVPGFGWAKTMEEAVRLTDQIGNSVNTKHLNYF